MWSHTNLDARRISVPDKRGRSIDCWLPLVRGATPQLPAMPATPRFKVSQTDVDVVVVIKVPHVRVGGAETHVDGTEFSFYCKPYLLR